MNYLDQVFEQKRPIANMSINGSYVCVGRAHSAAIVDFGVYMAAVGENTELAPLVPASKAYLNAY